MLSKNYSIAFSDHQWKRLSLLSPSFKATLTQQQWDKMFMIDLYPENRARFGVNWFEIVDLVLKAQSKKMDKGT